MEWKFSPKARGVIRTIGGPEGARINLLDGAVRSSKTVVTCVAWLLWLRTAPPGDLAIIGKTERTVARNVLPYLELLAGRHYRYNKGEGVVTIFGRPHFVYGANDERAEAKIRGLTLAGALGDEVTLWPEGFFAQLQARLSVPGARGVYTTNPDSPYHWLKTGVIDREAELNLRRWHFVLADNPALDPEYVRDLERLYPPGSLFHRRFVLGEWVAAEGAVFDQFDPDRHTLEGRPVPYPDYWVLGMDYGASNPTAAVLVGVLEGPISEGPYAGVRAWVDRELYLDPAEVGRGLTTGEVAERLARWLGEDVLTAGYLDPAAEAMSTELARSSSWRADLANIRDADNEVLPGIATLTSMLHPERPELLIRRDTCPRLVAEVSGYAWDAKAQAKGEDKPLKQNDHAVDALRYAVHSHFGAREVPRIRGI